MLSYYSGHTPLTLSPQIRAPWSAAKEEELVRALPLHTSSDLSEWPHPEKRAGTGMPSQEEGSAHPLPGLLLHLNYPVPPSSEPLSGRGCGRTKGRDTALLGAAQHGRWCQDCFSFAFSLVLMTLIVNNSSNNNNHGTALLWFLASFFQSASRI